MKCRDTNVYLEKREAYPLLTFLNASLDCFLPSTTSLEIEDFLEISVFQAKFSKGGVRFIRKVISLALIRFISFSPAVVNTSSGKSMVVAYCSIAFEIREV